MMFSKGSVAFVLEKGSATKKRNANIMKEDTAIRYHEAFNLVKGFSIAAGRDLLHRLGASVLQKIPSINLRRICTH